MPHLKVGDPPPREDRLPRPEKRHPVPHRSSSSPQLPQAAYLCLAKCHDNPKMSTQAVRSCSQGCEAPLNQLNAVVQQEFGSFQVSPLAGVVSPVLIQSRSGPTACQLNFALGVEAACHLQRERQQFIVGTLDEPSISRLSTGSADSCESRSYMHARGAHVA